MTLKRLVKSISPNRKLTAAILLFGLTLICLLWGGFVERMQFDREAAAERTQEESGNLARAFEEHILQTLNRANHLTVLIKNEYEEEGPRTSILASIQQAHMGNFPVILLSIADENGNVILSSQKNFVPSNIKDRNHFKVHQASDDGRLFISDPVLGRSSGKWSVQMTRRLNKPDGSFAGVVVVSVDPLGFIDFYNRAELKEDIAIALVKPGGTILAAKTKDHAFFGQILKEPDSQRSENWIAGDSGRYTSDNAIDTTKRIYSYRTLFDFPLTVLVGLSEKEVLEISEHRQKSYFLTSVFLTLFIAAACCLLLYMLFHRQLLEEKRRKQEEETKRELELAARVQQAALPQPFAGCRVKISTVFAPYHTVSGDLVNYQWFDRQQKLRGYVVDVSGHGVATALQTSTVKMLLDDRLLSGKKISEKDFQFINRAMIRYLYEESFAALLYFEFDFTSSVLTIISGGINLFFTATSRTCTLVPVYSCYLGLLDNADVKTLKVSFAAGDIYGMLSDGASDLIEAKGAKRQHGFEEYLAWFEKLSQSPDRSDDFSTLCIEILPEPYDPGL